MPAKIFGQLAADLQIAGYFPMARRKFVYVYAESFVGKNSLNLDSGMICSTFFTLAGLLAAPGEISSTWALARVQEVESLRDWISAVIGSLDRLPQIVPVQLVEGTGPPVPAETCVEASVPAPGP